MVRGKVKGSVSVCSVCRVHSDAIRVRVGVRVRVRIRVGVPGKNCVRVRAGVRLFSSSLDSA